MSDTNNDVNTADVQDSASVDSSTTENNNLEVVESGEPIDPRDVQGEEEETEGQDDNQETDDSQETEETQDPDQPREAKNKANNRIRELVAENNMLKNQVRQNLRSQIQQNEDNAQYSDDPNDRVASLEQRIAQNEFIESVAELNTTLNAEADAVSRDLPFMNPDNPDRTPEDIALAEEIMDLWFEAADVKTFDDDQGNTFIANARLPLYSFVNKMAGIRSSGMKQGEVTGQKAAEKTLSAVEAKPIAKPSRSNADDAKLSADEYAKKYGLTVERV